MDETGDGPAEGDPQRSHRGAPAQPGEPDDLRDAPRPGAPAWLPGRLRSSWGQSAARGAWSRASRHPSEARAHDEMSAVPRAATSPSGLSGTSNFARAEVPYGIDLAAAWSWRLLVIVAAGYVVLQAVELLAVVLLPVVVALFVAALTVPAVDRLSRSMPRGVAALLVVLGVLGTLVVMLSFATQQVVDGFSDLIDQTVEGLEQIEVWLQDGPLQISEQQINQLLQEMQDLVATSSELVSRVTQVSATVGHVVAGVFIVLFSTYFFLADGDRIWAWVVRIFPVAARRHADSSGRVAWLSLTQFVRATVLVAAVDAIGVMIVAAVLGVPFVGAIGVLVFLGAFVPVIGATISGMIAVLVALVAQGPVAALLMLLGVVGVQQLESHLLQPFLMGRMVRLHPLGVILAVAGGVLIAGIAGALIAVPVVASVNAVATHLAGQGRAVESSEVTTDEEEQVPDEPGGAS